MRLDKYLWCIRTFKTRTLAAMQCKLGKVWVNDEPAKASRELKKADVVKVRKGPIHFSFCVLDFPGSRLGAKLVSNYAQDITPAEERAKLELIKLQSREQRPRGLGRPTKRERRQLDEFTEFTED